MLVHVLSGLQMCPNTVFESCEGDNTGQSYNMPVVVFFISQFFLGVSVSSYHSIGIVYLDDNLKKNEMPIYYGASQYSSTAIDDMIIHIIFVSSMTFTSYLINNIFAGAHTYKILVMILEIH